MAASSPSSVSAWASSCCHRTHDHHSFSTFPPALNLQASPPPLLDLSYAPHLKRLHSHAAAMATAVPAKSGSNSRYHHTHRIAKSLIRCNSNNISSYNGGATTNRREAEEGSSAPSGLDSSSSSSSSSTPGKLDPPPRIIIAGGGIGGLVLALAAKNKGMSVRVLERDLSAIRGEGQYRGPIQIQSNALAALEAVDASVAEEIMEKGCVTGDRINGLVDGLSGDW